MAVETAAYTEQTDIQRDITEMVRQFVDEQILPNAEIEASRLLTRNAAQMKDAGIRSDLEVGMAKLLALETDRFCVEAVGGRPGA